MVLALGNYSQELFLNYTFNDNCYLKDYYEHMYLINSKICLNFHEG